MAYVVGDSFCVVADVQTRAQRGVYDVNSSPTLQQVLDSMARRAVQIEGVLRKAGVLYTVPTRDKPFPAYGAGTDEEDRLRVMCEDANAIGAALDAVQLQDALARSTSSELIKALMELYTASLANLSDYCVKIAGNPAASTTNPNVSTSYATGATSDAANLWGLDTKW